MGESEDCSHLVMSGGEELREMAPSSSDRMEVDNENKSLVVRNEAPNCHLSQKTWRSLKTRY